MEITESMRGDDEPGRFWEAAAPDLQGGLVGDAGSHAVAEEGVGKPGGETLYEDDWLIHAGALDEVKCTIGEVRSDGPSFCLDV